MKIESVSKPTAAPTENEALKPEPLKEKRTNEAPAKAVADTPTTKKRLVVGKRAEPILPPTGGVTFESIIGLDERTHILETEHAPWRMVCALEIEGPWGNFIGTGWFAGPRTIVTAGHCVFERAQMGGWATTITVTPGRDADEKPFSSMVSQKFSSVDRWINDQDPDFDIGAIHLDEPVGETVGWFQVASLADEQLLGYMVNVTGYPGSPGGGTEQWWAKNRIRAVTPRRIFYDVDTSGGQSGGAVFILEDENKPPVIVGIHAYGVGGTPANIPVQVNSAPRIIPEIVDRIQQWIDQDKVG